MTFKLNRIETFFISLAIVALAVFSLRIKYLLSGQVTTGEVINIDRYHTRRGGSYTKPIIQFNAKGYEVTFEGESNMSLRIGDKVKVIYQESDLTDALIYNFVGFWLRLIYYHLFISFVFVTPFVFSFLEKNDTLIITFGPGLKIKVTKNTGQIA